MERSAERRRIYLDNNATTQVCGEAAEAALLMMRENYGNPSSLHGAGLEAERTLKSSRARLASVFGAGADEVFFNSGGTEGDNTAIFGVYGANMRRGRHIITTEVEHPAVLQAMRELEARGAEVTYIGVDGYCRTDPEKIRAALRPDTIMISVMTVNNETGTVMPIRQISEIKGQAVLHTDAVQAFGKLDLRATGADIMTVSGHKAHAPKGTGAMYVRKGVKIRPLILGGGQERGFRSGTENMPGIAALAAAAAVAEDCFDDSLKHLCRLNRMLREGIEAEIADIRINSPEDACPAVLNVSFLGTRGEVILHSLEEKGICVSTGSACSSGGRGGSHVLKAMGLSREAVAGAVRFSLSRYNTEEEIEYTVGVLKKAVADFRRLGTFR